MSYIYLLYQIIFYNLKTSSTQDYNKTSSSYKTHFIYLLSSYCSLTDNKKIENIK